MKVLLPLNENNYTDFNLVGKTLVCKRGMFEVENKTIKMQMGVDQKVLMVDNQVVGVFLHNNKEVYLISEV
jgi:hypothetical protein